MSQMLMSKLKTSNFRRFWRLLNTINHFKQMKTQSTNEVFYKLKCFEFFMASVAMTSSALACIQSVVKKKPERILWKL